MDHQAFAQLLGNYGEFIGAIAVVVTLVYLAAQVRQGKVATEANTHALEANRRLALAQTYQARAEVLDARLTQLANSGELAPFLFSAMSGETEIDTLSDEQSARLRLYSFGLMNWFDNMYYQYQQGFLEEEFYQSSFKNGVKLNGPLWIKWNQLAGMRQPFQTEVRAILETEQISH